QALNQDDEAEPYRDAARTFDRLEPAYLSTLAVFAGHGLHPLVLMTARGYHFVLKAVRGTPLHASLVEMGPLGPSLPRRCERMGVGVAAGLEMCRAHEGAGRLLEHLVHEIGRDLAGRSAVPVMLADLRPPGGGPFLGFDLSAYADPVFVRSTRCAFSSDQTALVGGFEVRDPVVLVLPRGKEPLGALLRARLGAERAQALAETADARVPAAAGGAECVQAYRAAPLARFHHAFDEACESDPRAGPRAYEALDLGNLPACAVLPLRAPNPALLRAGGLRSVALALWARGWHPRAIAALVRSRYARPFAWGSYWHRYDAESRARFYVRLCCGALAAGAEDAGAFTCDTQRARGLCVAADCGFDLARAWEARGRYGVVRRRHIEDEGEP
ncbi:MAG TPA: hypothetical protein VFO85_05550, partial [Vicinamibacteria bacterium]|nr:hypothetical protein [Vicinamibacteria bacterium]